MRPSPNFSVQIYNKLLSEYWILLGNWISKLAILNQPISKIGKPAAP